MKLDNKYIVKQLLSYLLIFLSVIQWFDMRRLWWESNLGAPEVEVENQWVLEERRCEQEPKATSPRTPISTKNNVVKTRPRETPFG